MDLELKHLTVARAEGVTHVTIEPGTQVSGQAVRELYELAASVLDETNVKLLVDLTGAGMASSGLMGMLVTIKKKCLGTGAQFHVVVPDDRVMQAFELMNLQLILKLFGNVDAARGGFKA